MGNTWETHGKHMGNTWETHRKHMGNTWETHGKVLELSTIHGTFHGAEKSWVFDGINGGEKKTCVSGGCLSDFKDIDRQW